MILVEESPDLPMLVPMRGSYAYEPILDPSDPAWCGHAESHPGPTPWWQSTIVHRTALVAATVGGLLVLALLISAVIGRDAPPAKAAGNPGTSPADAPRLPVVPPAATSAVVPATAPAVAAPSSEAQLMQELAAARAAAPKVTIWHADLSGSRVPVKFGLTGDLMGLDQDLYLRLDQLSKRLKLRVDVLSGARTREEQQQLHIAFLNGTGNLAAPPGHSRHEAGQAADVYIDDVALANVPGVRAAAAALGLGFPVPGEAWHVEVMVPST